MKTENSILDSLYLNQFTNTAESKMILHLKTVIMHSWTMSFTALACGDKSIYPLALDLRGNRK